MKSKTAKRILDRTSDTTKKEVSEYADKLILSDFIPSGFFPIKAFEQELLNRWGFTKDGGVSVENQLKIFSLIEWVKANLH